MHRPISANITKPTELVLRDATACGSFELLQDKVQLAGGGRVRPSAKPIRSLRGSGVEPSALRPQLRRIAIKFCRDIFAGGGGSCQGKSQDRSDRLRLLLRFSCQAWASPSPTARADDCLAAPNSPAPQGSHWYYRLDWATQRKCWYVRAPGPPAQQAAAPATLARVPIAFDASCVRAKVCAGDHTRQQTNLSSEAQRRKYRAVNARGTRSASKHVVAN